uniref:Protein krueppel n=1 Tax=Phlebotomus papatasi TaxID=29031 RepID=A0A1B0DQC9_PHLPP
MECPNIANNCRACQDLIQKESQIFIFTSLKLPDIFRETTSLNIDENDELPNVLCRTCYDRLLDAYNFRKMCSAAVVQFHKILSMDAREEKYIPPKDVTESLMSTTSDAADTDPTPMDTNGSPDRDVSFTDMISIDDGLPGGIKTEPDDEVLKKRRTSPKKSKDKKGSKEVKNDPPKEVPNEEDKTITNQFTESKTPQKGKRKNKDVKVSISKFKSLVNIHTNEKIWLCDSCPYKSNLRQCITRHAKLVHQGIKEYQCHICNKSFGDSSSLTFHIRLHTGERPYACDKCNKKFIRFTQLKTHMNIHTGERVFLCEFCPYKSIHKVQLDRHVKVVHLGLKNFHCSHCQGAFGTKIALKIHMRTHTGEKPFACSECQMKFSQKISLETHPKHLNKFPISIPNP